MGMDLELEVTKKLSKANNVMASIIDPLVTDRTSLWSRKRTTDLYSPKFEKTITPRKIRTTGSQNGRIAYDSG